jgi:hypothetical protein
MANGKCRDCGLSIHFAKSERGNTMIIDPAPVENGNVKLVTIAGVRMAVVLKKGESYDGNLYVVHQATCPKRQRKPSPEVDPLEAVRRVRKEVEAERRGTLQAVEAQD